MSKFSPPSPLHADEYEAIETALLESSRGRWFLNEFSRRNRSADTQMLLEAITKLEATMLAPRDNAGQDHIRQELIEMSEAISRTRAEIAAITASNDDNRLVSATEELDAIVEATEKATSDILEAAEDVQETAWVLREQGVDDAACDKLDGLATEIYTACSFQDITGQRTSKVVAVLRYLEEHVNSLVDAWGLDDVEVRHNPISDDRPDAHLLNGPQLDGRGLEQEAVDGVFVAENNEAELIENTSTMSDAVTAHVPALEADNPPQANGFVGAPADSSAETIEHATGEAPMSGGCAGTTAENEGEQAGGTVTASAFSADESLQISSLDPDKAAALFS